MKVYVLSAFNIQGQYQVYVAHFSNKKAALSTMAELREYYIGKYSVDTGNVRVEGQSTEKNVDFKVNLDEKIQLRLISWDMFSKPLKGFY